MLRSYLKWVHGSIVLFPTLTLQLFNMDAFVAESGEVHVKFTGGAKNVMES